MLISDEKKLFKMYEHETKLLIYKLMRKHYLRTMSLLCPDFSPIIHKWTASNIRPLALLFPNCDHWKLITHLVLHAFLPHRIVCKQAPRQQKTGLMGVQLHSGTILNHVEKMSTVSNSYMIMKKYEFSFDPYFFFNA